MDDMWAAVAAGDVGEMERLVGEDPGLVNARIGRGYTPLMLASLKGHMEVVRCLLDHGATVNERDNTQRTALRTVSSAGLSPVVRLLLERGADPTLADQNGWTPLIAATVRGHLEVVRSLLGHPTADSTINYRLADGATALWRACMYGRGGMVRALLESGADPTIPTNSGVTPMDVAKDAEVYPQGVTAEGRRECVAALEVSFRPLLSLPQHLLISWLMRRTLVGLGVVAGRGAGLPAMEGPAGRRCGLELRGAAGGGGEDARRGQASARGGSAGGAEESRGGRGR
jgi:hypothetical protein